MDGSIAYCDAGNVRMGPCKWQCGGCNFDPAFALRVGCTSISDVGSCPPGWERAVCRCTDLCPQLRVPSAPPSLMLLDGGALEVARPLQGYASSHGMRRLAVISVAAGAGMLRVALDAASAGDELVLANGTFMGSGWALWTRQITRCS